MSAKDTGGAALKAGDRVEVVAGPDGGEPDGSCGGRYFQVGSTGTVIDPASALVRFDEAANDALGMLEWLVDPACLRPLAARKEAT